MEVLHEKYFELMLKIERFEKRNNILLDEIWDLKIEIIDFLKMIPH